VPKQVATLAELCELSRLRGRLEEAAEFGARGLRLVEDVRGVGEELRLYTVLAALHLDLRHYEEAVEAATHVVRLAHANRQPDAEADALAVLGQIRYAIGEPEEAAYVWLQAVEIFDGRGRADRAAELRARIAELNVSQVLEDDRDYGPLSVSDNRNRGKISHPYR
jgi:tetratricopeptide (TPR) repeat protein